MLFSQRKQGGTHDNYERDQVSDAVDAWVNHAKGAK